MHYSTYGTQHPLTNNNSFARTSVQRAPTAIILFPLSTTLSLEQYTSSCHTFPLRGAAGFIFVSTRNTITGGKICIRVLPVFPFSPCDAHGISCYPHPEGEPCVYVYNDSFFLGADIWSGVSLVSGEVWDYRKWKVSVKSLRSSAVFGGRLQRPLPRLIRSAPRRERGWGLSETSEKCANFCMLNGTLQLLFGP